MRNNTTIIEDTTEAVEVAPVEPPANPETIAAQPDEAADAETTLEPEDVFPRSYVEELRQENGKHRQRAQKAEERLHTELVRATGRLADPTDLPFDDTHLEDAAALTLAIDELLARKPHLAARRPVGDIGQGATPAAGAVDLAAILRGGR